MAADSVAMPACRNAGTPACRYEVRGLLIKDVDFDRNMIHVRQGKGRKDRYVPIGTNLSRGLKKYLDAEQPSRWLFKWKGSPCPHYFQHEEPSASN